MKMKSALVAAMMVLTAAFSMAAENEAEKKDDVSSKKTCMSMSIDGYYRLRWTDIDDMDLFPNREVPGARYWDQRLRLAPVVTVRPGIPALKSLTFHATADIWDGSFHISDERSRDYRYDERTWDVQFLRKEEDWKEDGFFLKEYWVEMDLTAAVIRVGRMGSEWGTGILANPGYGYDDDFGDNYFGDITERVLVATKPIDLISGGSRKTDLILAVAYDWLVIQDNTGDEDDDPSQFIVAVMKEPESENGDLIHDLTAGIYYVHRTQDKDTVANVLDITGILPYSLKFIDFKIVSSFEGVYIWGSTDVNKSINAPDGSDVEMYGFMASLAAESKKLDIIGEVGYASGDPDPFDDEINNFSFNPDYNVGLILFERVLSAASAFSTRQFENPNLAADPPRGIDELPTNGSVTNAIYLYPRLKFRPIRPFELVGGLLYAYAPSELIDPYRTFLNGGVPTNYNGGDADSDLGWEVDFGFSVSSNPDDKQPVTFKAGGQWGWFFPGAAFDDADGDSMEKIYFSQFRLDVIF